MKKRVILILSFILISSVTYAVGPYELGPGEWSSQTVGLLGQIGGISGTFIGLFAAITVWFTLRGRARRLVMAVWYVLLALGIAYMVIAVIAIANRQPCNVYCPILLAGILNALLPIAAILLIRWHYRRREMRSMSAQDVGHGLGR